MAEALAPVPVPPAAPGLWKVFVFPAAISLLLSAATVGTFPYWQDSAFYLIAVKEFSVLYPPGFVLYLSLCKAWTLLLSPFCDFTLSVHLFSSLCASLAAGFLALAAQRWTADRLASALAGALAAAGYTWWFSGIYAKGYALYYLIVALLLWRMACRDPLRAAALLGLSWAAHPSAALLGPAFAVYLWTIRTELRAIGGPRLALWSALAVLGALGPSLFLPLITARESPYALGDPRTARDVVAYLTGSRFTSIPGVWGFDGRRWLNMGRYIWEEFLGVGLLLLAAGLPRFVRERSREGAVFLVWSLTIAVVSALFKMEGQNDLWLVVAYMPLWIVVAFGMSELRSRVAWGPLGAAAAGLLWAAAANGGDLYLRGYALPELFGRCFLQNLDPGSTIMVYSDDAIGLVEYQQVVRGYRPDVKVVVGPHLNPRHPEAWYLRSVARRWPALPLPDLELAAVQLLQYTDLAVIQAALINAQPPQGPPVFLDAEPAHELLRNGTALPAGVLWKWSGAGPAAPDPHYWALPVTLEQASARRGRKRGQKLAYDKDHYDVAPEDYEWRLIRILAEARRAQAGILQRSGTARGFAESAALYESIFEQVPEYRQEPQLLYPLALSCYMVDRLDKAELYFSRCRAEPLGASMSAGVLFYLAEIRRAQGRSAEAGELYREALKAAPPDSPLRDQVKQRLQ